MSLIISNLHISAADKEIIRGLNLAIKPGEVHAIMGPNGSGKSTLAAALLGHPHYEVTQGKIMIDQTDATRLSPDERARRGLFLSMQYPPEIPGVSLANFSHLATSSLSGKNVDPLAFRKILAEKIAGLKIKPEFATRSLGTGFSGGEKKRSEILQLLLFNPKYAILDEIDSGLDVDALKIVANGINRFKNKKNAVVLITHYNRILKYVAPDKVHVMVRGKIVKSGDKKLANEIEEKGYKNFTK